jgi:hypothetical protein
LSTNGVPVPCEREVQRRVVATLKAFGFRVFNLSQGYRPGGRRHGTTRQTKGLGDLWAMHAGSGAVLWWETKRPGGQRTSEQVQFGELCAACDVPYGFGGVAELKDLLRSLGFKILSDKYASVLGPFGEEIVL